LDEFGYVPYDRTGSQLLFDYLTEIHEQKSVILNMNLEFSQLTCPQCMIQLVVEKALGFAVVAEALECA